MGQILRDQQTYKNFFFSIQYFQKRFLKQTILNHDLYGHQSTHGPLQPPYHAGSSTSNKIKDIIRSKFDALYISWKQIH